MPCQDFISVNVIGYSSYKVIVFDAQLCRFVATLTANGGDITIPIDGIEAVVSGQGLAAVGEWDGYLDLEDIVDELVISSMTIERDIEEEVSISQDVPYRLTLIDTVNDMTIQGMTLEGFTEELVIDKRMMSSYTHQELSAYTHEDLHNGFIHG